ncbi:MAG TPA: T9SS type A sorting domain-containing protein, partial [Bacteroidales bacterium]|nr:T9SS type A sorting domain-containing protein [Bacteroidales bacterium]
DNDPASFTLISDPPYMEAPTDWTEMYYDLSAYDGQTVYVAIQGVTADAFIFMVDDISIDYYTGTPEIGNVNFSVYPNPVVNDMTITSDSEMNRIEIFNQLGQKVFARDIKEFKYRVNASEFENGVYYIRITAETGVTTQKVTIK